MLAEFWKKLELHCLVEVSTNNADKVDLEHFTHLMFLLHHQVEMVKKIR